MHVMAGVEVIVPIVAKLRRLRPRRGKVDGAPDHLIAAAGVCNATRRDGRPEPKKSDAANARGVNAARVVLFYPLLAPSLAAQPSPQPKPRRCAQKQRWRRSQRRMLVG